MHRGPCDRTFEQPEFRFEPDQIHDFIEFLKTLQ